MRKETEGLEEIDMFATEGAHKDKIRSKTQLKAVSNDEDQGKSEAKGSGEEEGSTTLEEKTSAREGYGGQNIAKGIRAPVGTIYCMSRDPRTRLSTPFHRRVFFSTFLYQILVVRSLLKTSTVKEFSLSLRSTFHKHCGKRPRD